MIHRAHVLVALTLTLVFGFAAPAFGWANGGDDGNGYGSHDWILDEALRLAGTSGSWVDRDTALLATDDPDSAGVPGIYHCFHEEGLGRGAPSRVEYHYWQAVRSLEDGDATTASKHLGILSHYYADVLQPFHAAYDGRNYDSLHAAYEYAVDDYQHASGNVRAWITPSVRQPIADIRARVVEAGYYSRAQYPSLLSAWKKRPSVSDPTVLAVTKRVQSRAANDLADVIATIPTGKGCAECPAAISTSVSNEYPGVNQNVLLSARCTDAAGVPIEGVMVEFRIGFASGTIAQVAFTDADGLAKYWQSLSSAAAMKRVHVTATAGASGGTISGAMSFVPTPVLADGTSGVLMSISSVSPPQGSQVTSQALVRDRSGRPVVGLPVRFSWHHDSGTIYTEALTDAAGVATSIRDIGSSTAGYRVWVKARVESGGQVRMPVIGFTPVAVVSSGSGPTIYIDDTSAAVTFDRFVPCSSSSYSAGTYTYGRWTGTSIESRFQGTRIVWVGPKQPGYGMADVYLDGKKIATVDCYAPKSTATLSTVLWDSGALSHGGHTLSIRLTGKKNPASGGYVVVLDRLVVADASVERVPYRIDESEGAFSGSWIACSNPTYTASSYHYSRWPGARVKYTFRGTKVAWLGPRTPFYGRAAVYVDGVHEATVSQYGMMGWRCRVWESGILPPGEHTIEIRVLGTKDAGSSGLTIVVDGFDVAP